MDLDFSVLFKYNSKWFIKSFNSNAVYEMFLKMFRLQVNLNDGMDKILKSLDKYPVKTRLSLTGTLIVARDIAHAKLQERLNSEGSLPQYFKDHPVYYAGPAKTPEVSFQRYIS